MSKQYHLFLDDERFPKDVTWLELPMVHWVIVRNYKQFVETIERDGVPLTVSFDHDLADEHYQEYHVAHDERMLSHGQIRYDKLKEKTGYECAKWLAQFCVDKHLPLPVYYLHTMNGIGKDNMRSVLESARKVITMNQPKCQKCGEPVNSDELHPCPYSEDVNNDPTPCCNCCPDCCRQCAEDI
jgi:hypothetical protein